MISYFLSLLSHNSLCFPLYSFFSPINFFLNFLPEFPFPPIFLSSHPWEPDTGLVRKAASKQLWKLPQGTSLITLTGLAVSGNPVPGAAGQPTKQINAFHEHEHSFNDSSQIQPEPMGRLQSSQAVLHTSVPISPGVKAGTEARCDESIRVMKQSEFKPERLYLI